MAFQNRYFKNPVGRNNNFSFIGITAQVAYSAAASYTAFVTTSVAGEVGIFSEATGLLVSGAGAVSTTLPIFIAINKGSGKIERSETFTVAASKITRTPYVAPVKGTNTFVFNAASAVVTGDVLAIKILDLTAQSHPMSSFDFYYTVKAGDTFDTAMAALTAIINDTAGVLLKDRDQLVTATYTAGTNTLLISNVDFSVVTKVLLQEKLATLTVDTNTIVKTVLGSGFPDEVKLFEEAMLIRDGVTTNYPKGGTIPGDYASWTSLVGTTVQYNHYTFLMTRSDDAKIVHKVQFNPTCLELVVAANGAANAEVQIKAIFGL